MEKRRLIFSFCTLLAGFILISCSISRAAQPEPTATAGIVTVQVSLTPTPTMVIGGMSPQTEEPVIPLSGILETRVPDPFGSGEFCAFNSPYTLVQTDDMYVLSGAGVLDCYFFTTYEAGIKQHLKMDYEVTLSGEMPAEPGSVLLVDYQLNGTQDGYFSDLPPGAPNPITELNPFHVPSQVSLPLKFEYSDGAYCIYNQNGVLTSLPGEPPITGEDGWLFILHPGKSAVE